MGMAEARKEEEEESWSAPGGEATSWSRRGLFLLLVVVPVAVSVGLFRAEEFDPAHLPDDCTSPPLSVANHSTRVLQHTERVGEGLLPGPEDLAYDAVGRVLYTSCSDGWIRRFSLEQTPPAVEDWAYVGGRPLGIAFGGADGNTLVVANADTGLLAVAADGSVYLLADEAEGLKFGLTDGVDVASDGKIYFTDASYKYNLETHTMDIVEGRPYGRFLSFDPATNRTDVLVRDLYFANGVVVSPDQQFIIFCETVLRRCQRYYIQGEKKGSVDIFIKNLPGFPDNIRYDDQGYYWIALASEKNIYWDVTLNYPFVRKLLVLLGKYVKIPNFQRNGGLLGVSLEGEPLVLYTDPDLKGITGGLKIGRHLYFGYLHEPYISRIDIDKHAARAAN